VPVAPSGSVEDPVLASGGAAGFHCFCPWFEPRPARDRAVAQGPPGPRLRRGTDPLVRGYRHVAGIDEVGRGCLAGPVTVGRGHPAARLEPRGLRDSKLLKPEERRRLDVEIREHAVAWSIAFVGPS
jgi:ribonuclease HII